MSRKRKASDPPEQASLSENVFTSNPINDRSSTFIGRFSPTASVKALQASPDFKDASHRMAAWRKASTQRVIALSSQAQRQLYDTGHDDDGEKYGGKRLEKLMDDLKVEGSLIVARWYGGVMLGPVRFTHIEECAKQAIVQWRESSQVEKRQKIQQEEDAARKSKLEVILHHRDQSITVLRTLLAEKSASSAPLPASSSPSAPASKQMDYTKMPLAALLKLEKARDATISWILGQISKAEAAAAASINDSPEEVDGVVVSAKNDLANKDAESGRARSPSVSLEVKD